MKFIKNLFKSQNTNTGKLIEAKKKSRKKGSRRKEQPLDFEIGSVKYIPLPSPPKTWEIDGREEFNREYNDPELKEIFSAGWKKHYLKTIKLAKGISLDKLKGNVGEVIAEAYRKITIQRMKANQIKPAAKWAKEMLDIVPTHCKDVDKRRYNKIVRMLDKNDTKHDYEFIDAPRTTDTPLFEIQGNRDWLLEDINKIPSDDRPDTAFKPIAITRNGILLADERGKSKLAINSAAALQKYDNKGHLVSEKSLKHGIYRFGCGPESPFCAIMDKQATLHLYDPDLNKIMEHNLDKDIRITEHFRTTDTNYWGELHSQVRAIDVNKDGTSFLFTISDEAWCCSIEGNTKWGIRLPLNEGWSRVVKRTERTGPSEDVKSALSLMNLSLPVTLDEVKKKYRELVFKHHPDRNPGDTDAKRRMQEINLAFEVITGIDPATINVNLSEEEITFFHKSPDSVFDVGPFRMTITITGGSPQDWIYGASFASDGEGAYLASYSGKVIYVSTTGKPIRVYDLGSIANEIAEQGDYLYLKTDTRLYILKNKEQLVQLIDIYKKGRVLVGTRGIGLLASKQLEWYTPDGDLVGTIVTRHPIRTVYNSPAGTIIETKQHRALLNGLNLL